MDRFFLRMAGTMIGAGRDWRQEGESGGTEKRPRSNKGIVFHIFQTVVLPGKSMWMALADKYEAELATWYWMSLRSAIVSSSIMNSFEIFMDQSQNCCINCCITCFTLGVERLHKSIRTGPNWQIKRHSALSLVKQQLDEAHRELLEKEFISRWEYVPIRTPEGRV